jgi:serine/threonine-protein kinase
MSFEIGDEVGDYRIVGAAGSGGAGRVFRVEHAITGRIEAMKVLLEGRTDSEAPAERFQREIKLQAKLDHPGIASVHNAFWANEELVMIMELVDGNSLDRLIAGGPANIEPALRFGMQSLEALDYAHRQGVTHRDVKPENIMVTADGRVKLMDFGLAKEAKDPKLTQMGSVVGSVFYISPEQARGSADVDHRTDIYSFGAVLYELVTGRKPFPHTNSYALLQAAVSETPAPPLQIRPDMPAALNNAIMKAMAKDPNDRFQDAEEFRLALQVLAVDSGTSTDAPAARSEAAAPPVSPEARAQQRKRMLFVAAGLITVVYLGLNYLSRAPEESNMAAAEAATAGPDLGGYRSIQTIALGKAASFLGFSSDGRRLIVADAAAIRLFDAINGTALGSFEGLQDAAVDVQLSPDGHWAAATSASNEAVLWDARSFEVSRRLTHAGRVTAIAFSGDSRYLATGSADRTLRVWDLRNPAVSEVFSGPDEGPRDLTFSPTAPLLASIGADGLVKFSALRQSASEQLDEAVPGAHVLNFSSSGLEFVAYGERSLTLWDVPSRSIRARKEIGDAVLSLNKCPSGMWTTLNSSSGDPPAAELHNVNDGTLLLAIPHSSPIVAGSFTADCKYLATATEGGTLAIWQPSLP